MSSPYGGENELWFSEQELLVEMCKSSLEKEVKEKIQTVSILMIRTQTIELLVVKNSPDQLYFHQDASAE